MSIHFRGNCYRVKDVECEVQCETKWNDHKQPHLVMQGWCSEVIIDKNKGIIK